MSTPLLHFFPAVKELGVDPGIVYATLTYDCMQTAGAVADE